MRIVTAGADRTVKVWEFAAKDAPVLVRQFHGHAGGANCAAFLPDGRRVLTGGADKDQFRFDSAPSSKSNVDHITDFKHGTDKIALDDAIFDVGPSLESKEFLARSSGHEATSGKHRIIYDKSSGELWYDADGKKNAHDPIKFAVIDNKPALDFHDFTIV